MPEPVEKVEVEIVDDPAVDAAQVLQDGFHAAGASLLLRAALMVVLGLLLVVNPGGSIRLLTQIIGVVLLIFGAIGVTAALGGGVARSRFFASRGVRGMALFNSAAIALIGLFSLISPEKANIFWVLMIGLWQLITGLQCLFGGRRSPFLWSSGLLSVVIGVVLLIAPLTSLLTMVWFFGILLIAAGVWIGYAGFRLRRL